MGYDVVVDIDLEVRLGRKNAQNALAIFPLRPSFSLFGHLNAEMPPKLITAHATLPRRLPRPPLMRRCSKMRTWVTALTLILLASPSYSQTAPQLQLWREDKPRVSEEEIQRKQDAESAYRWATESQRNQNSGATDPWGSVRSAHPSQNSQKKRSDSK
jgi:hypothetical protein